MVELGMVYQPLEFCAAAVCRFITVSSIILVPEATRRTTVAQRVRLVDSRRLCSAEISWWGGCQLQRHSRMFVGWVS